MECDVRSGDALIRTSLGPNLGEQSYCVRVVVYLDNEAAADNTSSGHKVQRYLAIVDGARFNPRTQTVKSSV